MARYEDVDRNLETHGGVDTPMSPVNREGEAAIEKTAEDVRTLWIDVDGDWRAVVQESYVERFHDCSLEGPDIVVHLLKHMLRFGGSPRGWSDMWCREHHIDRKDRTCQELETLTEVIMLGGAYDQLRMPRLPRHDGATLGGVDAH